MGLKAKRETREMQAEENLPYFWRVSTDPSNKGKLTLHFNTVVTRLC
jgi:hypothetical protein